VVDDATDVVAYWRERAERAERAEGHVPQAEGLQCHVLH
jgi:hypothetical protein